MNRREFLTSIGITGAALTIVPSSLLSIDNLTVDEFCGYPPLHFTGLKAAQESATFAGQFLWCVLYEKDSKQDLGHWMCNVRVDCVDIRGRSLEGIQQHINHQLINSALTTERLMDGILADASQGLADLGKKEQIPNPDFNPSLPATTGYEDPEDGLEWNPRTIDGDPIKERVDRIRFVAWDDAGDMDLCPMYVGRGRDYSKLWTREYPPTPSWDIDELAQQVMMNLKASRYI